MTEHTDTSRDSAAHTPSSGPASTGTSDDLGGLRQDGPAPAPSQQDDHPAATTTEARPPVGAALAGVAVVVALAALTRFLERTVPAAAKGTAFAGVAAAIEFPVYAILLGLLGNVVLTRLGLRDRLAAGFRTEFFIKTGLVLLGASINFAVILTAAGPAILQALVLISVVFGFTWWLGGRLGLDDRLRALLSSAVSICGISAAIAAAGAVQAKREQLAYTASLVIVFALPSIFLLPAIAHGLGLSQPVAGAWIGGNIDTTAAVTAAGALAGEQALQLATIVKTTQNALLGVVAVALTAYFAVRVERSATSARPSAAQLWERFPKFVLGFLAASVIGTLYVAAVGSAAAKPVIGTVNDLRTLFLILAFVSIGLEFRVAPLREAGWRPVGVFASATVVNLLVGLLLAILLFRGFPAA
jgi:uncharacterized integral membrane protein (TIGR00698 family)